MNHNEAMVKAMANVLRKREAALRATIATAQQTSTLRSSDVHVVNEIPAPIIPAPVVEVKNEPAQNHVAIDMGPALGMVRESMEQSSATAERILKALATQMAAQMIACNEMLEKILAAIQERGQPLATSKHVTITHGPDGRMTSARITEG